MENNWIYSLLVTKLIFFAYEQRPIRVILYMGTIAYWQ